MQIINIESETDERIKHYRRLHFTPKLHTDEGLFVAEGSKTVRKLLRSSVKAISILTIETYLTEIITLIDMYNKSVETIYIAEKRVLDEVAGFKLHEGLLALGITPTNCELDDAFDKDSDCIVFLNGIVNSENVGSIVRNALAFGARTVIYDNKTSRPYLRRAVRVSLGSCFFIDFYKTNSAIEDLLILKKNGYEIIAIELSNVSLSLYKYTPKKKLCFIFGSESNGIDAEILNISDRVLHVPMNAEADSLNVAATSAIVLSKMYQINNYEFYTNK